MSNRVVRTLMRFVPDTEIYSIDESFLNLTNLEITNHTEFCKKIRTTVRQWTGIPISIGIASTKTLAKAANKIAKNKKDLGGVCSFTGKSEKYINSMLDKIEVKDVWGVGRQYNKLLKSRGIKTALDLKHTDIEWIKSNMTVQGQRTVLELRGQSCIPIDLETSPQKAICCSKSFGHRITKLNEIKEAIANYSARATEKLRAQKQVAGALQVFLQTSRFLEKKDRYFNSKTVSLPTATSATAPIVKSAKDIISDLFRPGLKYKKCGIVLIDLTPGSEYQFNMFRDAVYPGYEKDVEISHTVDRINSRWGRDTVKIAAQGTKNDWTMKQSHISNRYTTVWSELVRVRCK